MELSVEACWQR